MDTPTFSRVVVTGDLLRPFPVGGEWESATWKNIRWLHAVLGPALRANGHQATTLAWDDRGPTGVCHHFDTPSLYRRLGSGCSTDAWAHLAQRPAAPAELVEAMREPVTDALVIGYEMPTVMVDALRQLGRPFIDVVLHPLRFLPDLVFALRTNVPTYHRFIQSRRLRDSVVAQQAGLIQAKAAWMNRPVALLPPGSVLLLGQVAGDRAMVKPAGGFASLEEHLDRLHALCCEHPCVLFKPHPYEAEGTGARRAVGRLPAIIHTDANFYHLLAQPEIEGVVALNSSGLVEARAFGRWSESLIPALYDFDSGHPPTGTGAGAPIAQTPDWIEPGFWRGLLSGKEAPPPTDDGAQPTWAPNRLRRSMNADWGYSFIEKVIA